VRCKTAGSVVVGLQSHHEAPVENVDHLGEVLTITTTHHPGMERTGHPNKSRHSLKLPRFWQS